MTTKYNIDDRFIFIPKKNALIEIDDNNNLLTLGTNETRLLEYLIKHSDATVPRYELISILWNNREIYVDDSSLTQSVSTLRKALGDSTKLPIFIKTVPKVGYEFIASAKRIDVVTAKVSTHIKNNTHCSDNNTMQGTITPHFLLLYKQLMRFEVFVLLLLLTLSAELLYGFP
ncbi:winged helix-turn-helix domain-containing protein [Vibrio diabolicus]|uniref:Winged helix-turn-helix domain-containing protein n=1 Tax=Vibrio diabolicus TaxID=50719 RepID=A0AA92R738_9VIBR|nr:winged helix-turn-helix domain-containing protein [Vibrio diabolicus]QRG82281.1 winged helix-turn-helix domain-containing protein [Vibrio diabolicus]